MRGAVSGRERRAPLRARQAEATRVPKGTVNEAHSPLPLAAVVVVRRLAVRRAVAAKEVAQRGRRGKGALRGAVLLVEDGPRGEGQRALQASRVGRCAEQKIGACRCFSCARSRRAGSSCGRRHPSSPRLSQIRPRRELRLGLELQILPVPPPVAGAWPSGGGATWCAPELGVEACDGLRALRLLGAAPWLLLLLPVSWLTHSRSMASSSKAQRSGAPPASGHP